MKSLRYITLLTATAAFLLATNANASEAAANPFLGVLTTATSAELPAKAAELVTQADVKNLRQTTIDVVKAAVGLNPAAAPAILGSVVAAAPGMAATATATAVTLVPSEAVAIARAAAAAAPAKAGAIVEAICRVLPKSYQSVADAVAEVVPGAGKEILAGIIAAIPELKNIINETLASYDGKIPSVSTILTQVALADSSAGTAALSSGTLGSLPRGPSVSAPLVVPSGTPTLLNPGTGGQVPSGYHGYAAP